MTCEDVQSLLPDYYDDMLSPISRYAVQNHLKSCDACNKELHEIGVLFQEIAVSELEEPPQALRESFTKMLNEEIQKAAGKKNRGLLKKITSHEFQSFLWKAAALIIVFGGGIWLGTRIKPETNSASNAQINDLKTEVKDVKEMVMFRLLQEESASDRIQAVNYVNEMTNPDKKVIRALISTLNHDKNVNVRLASLYSLTKFADNQMVNDSLVSSLSMQTEPVIQIVLINMLTANKSTKAVKEIQEIIADGKTNKEVKAIAEKKLKTL
jgi:hypothetical protein